MAGSAATPAASGMGAAGAEAGDEGDEEVADGKEKTLSADAEIASEADVREEEGEDSLAVADG